jgi:prophage regulatory protein
MINQQPPTDEIKAILAKPYLVESLASFEDIPDDEVLQRFPATKSQTGLSVSGIYEGMAEGTFPKTISLGGRNKAHFRSDVALWIKKRAAIAMDKEALEAEQEAESNKSAERKKRQQAKRKNQNDSTESGEVTIE